MANVAEISAKAKLDASDAIGKFKLLERAASDFKKRMAVASFEMQGAGQLPTLGRSDIAEDMAKRDAVQRRLATSSTQLTGITHQQAAANRVLAAAAMQASTAQAVAHGRTQRLNVATMQLGFAVEDAAVSFGTGGLAGAVRGATNNLAAMAGLLGGLAPLYVTLALAAVNLALSLSKVASNAKKAKEAIEALTKARLANIEAEGREAGEKATFEDELAAAKTAEEARGLAEQREKQILKIKQQEAEIDRQQLLHAQQIEHSAARQAIATKAKLEAERNLAKALEFQQRVGPFGPGAEAGIHKEEIAAAEAEIAEQQAVQVERQEELNRLAQEESRFAENRLELQRQSVKAREKEAQLAAEELKFTQEMEAAKKQVKDNEKTIEDAKKSEDERVKAHKDTIDPELDIFGGESFQRAQEEAEAFRKEAEHFKGQFEETSKELDEVNKKMEEARKLGEDTTKLEAQRNRLLNQSATEAGIIEDIERDRANALIKAQNAKALEEVGAGILGDLDPVGASINKIMEEAANRANTILDARARGDITDDEAATLIDANEAARNKALEDLKKKDRKSFEPVQGVGALQRGSKEAFSLIQSQLRGSVDTVAKKSLEVQKEQAEIQRKIEEALRNPTRSTFEIIEADF